MTLALAISGFATAQTAQTKVFTPEQMQRAASKSAADKNSAHKFEEAPAGTAVTGGVSKTSDTKTVQPATKKSEPVKPSTTSGSPEKKN